MKLASLKHGRDGQLVVVSRDLQHMQPVTSIATTMQAALDSWSDTYPALSNAYRELNENQAKGLPFTTSDCAAPLPRAYQWADGSAYVHHVELVRKARGAELPDSFWHDPLMYQGGSDQFIGPNDNIEVISEDWGIDFEAEITVITDDVPMGVTAERASDFIRLFMLVNDVSLRNLISGELAKGFGFFQSKPSSAFSPVAVTPDELGNAWDGKKLHLRLIAELNGNRVGAPNAGVDMTFDFPTLIAHAAKSRPLGAGTIIGSGTISNRDRSNGSCCLAEVRMLETINQGDAKTPFMKFGDRIKIEMLNANQESIFGTIDQTVSQYTLA